MGGDDAGGDGVGEALAIGGGVGDAGAFARVAEEAAFDEDGGAAGVAEDVEGAAAHAAVVGAGGADELAVDGGGEAVSAAAVVECFDAVGAAAGGRVEVDADEDGVSLAVGDVRHKATLMLRKSFCRSKGSREPSRLTT